MTTPPTFAESRRNAYRLLGDAADELRADDWSITAGQREAVRRALALISEAKEALNEAAQ